MEGATSQSFIDNIDAIIRGQATASFGGARTTAKLLAILGTLDPDHIPTLKQILRVVGPFPVAGLAYWVDDWHAYRCCPKPHLHTGLDLMAARGTPLVAVADGVISEQVKDPQWSGLGIAVTDRNGIKYFYAHLSAFGPGMRVGLHVHRGQIVGYVGNTGDAAGGPTHCHFEIRINGVPTPPKPSVDRWLDIAEQRAYRLVRKLTGKKVKDSDLDYSLWKNQLLGLAQQEMHAANLEAARLTQIARANAPHHRPDQQTIPYGLPVALLALISGSALGFDRRRRPRVPDSESGAPVELDDEDMAILAEAEAALSEEESPRALVEL